MELKETFQKVKAASKTLGLLTDEQRNEVLQAVADAIIAETPALLKANAEDLAKMDKTNPLYDRATAPRYCRRHATRQHLALTARKDSQGKDA